jgi:hypothetical protein
MAGAACHVGRGHPVGDLVDGGGEVGAGALDLADQRVRRERGSVNVGLSHARHCTMHHKYL